MADERSVRELVADVIHTYVEACDRKEWECLDVVFAEHAVAEFRGNRLLSRREIVRYISTRLDRCGATQHLVSGLRITADGSIAQASCAVRASHRGAGQLTGVTYEVFGYYRDRLRLGPDGWRIVDHRLDITAETGSVAVLTVDG
jgi:hypothetical protein